MRKEGNCCEREVQDLANGGKCVMKWYKNRNVLYHFTCWEGYVNTNINRLK